MSSQNDSSVTKRKVNTISILDNIFNKHGWYKEYPQRASEYSTKLVYTTREDVFAKFIVEQVKEGSITTYKVAMPMTDTRYCYCTTIYSVFELLDYIDTVLGSQNQNYE